MSNARAIRYRRLALATEDKAIADLLLKLADECDQGLLCTAEWRSARLSRKNEHPPKVGDAKNRFDSTDVENSAARHSSEAALGLKIRTGTKQSSDG